MINSEKSKLNIETNFSFMKDIDLYEKSDIYKRICENARFAEGAYYINSDICNFYTRKTLELMCKFLEVSNNLSIHTKYNSDKKTIGTYLLHENYFEFVPAIGGIANYELLKRLNEGINPSAHEDYFATQNALELYDIITGLFQLMVWFYRDLGGKRNILKGDFDERKIPEEFDISFFFKNNDININVSERDKRYLQSLQRKKASEVKVLKNSEGVFIEDSLTGKNEFFISENEYNSAKEEYQNTVEQYEKKIAKISAEITNLRKNYADNEKRWFDEKEKIVSEIKKNEENLSRMHNVNTEKQKIIAQLRTQLDIEEEKHKGIIKSYVEYFTQMNRDMNSLKSECEKYRNQNEYLETIVVEYENLKAKYSAIKYQITTETQCPNVASHINQIVTDDYFTGMEQLRIYLLRLKDYYDKKEEKYNEEIRRMKEERDEFKEKYESERMKREAANKVTPNTTGVVRKKKAKPKYSLLVAFNFLIALLVLWGITEYTNKRTNENEEKTEAVSQNMESNETLYVEWEEEIAHVEEDNAGNQNSFVWGEEQEDENASYIEDSTIEEEQEDEINIEQNQVATPDEIELIDFMNKKIDIPKDFTCVSGINETLLEEIFYITSLNYERFENHPDEFEEYDRIEIWCVNYTDDFFRWTDDNMIVYKNSSIIKFLSYMNQNVMYAVAIEDFVDGLDGFSTLDDCKQVFGDKIYFFENAHPTSFSTSEEEDMTMFILEDGSKILLGWNKEGQICDYVYFYPLVKKYNRNLGL